MPDTWIADTLPPCSGVYDVALHLTSRRGRHARCVAVAHWPGRRSKRWDLLDLSVFDGVVIAWRPRPAPFMGDFAAPLGIIMPIDGLSRLAAPEDARQAAVIQPVRR